MAERTPQEFLAMCREANGPTRKQWEAHQKEMVEVRKRTEARKASEKK